MTTLRVSPSITLWTIACSGIASRTFLRSIYPVGISKSQENVSINMSQQVNFRDSWEFQRFNPVTDCLRRRVLPASSIPEISKSPTSSIIAQLSRGKFSLEILLISIHSTVSACGGFASTAEICIFPRMFSHFRQSIFVKSLTTTTSYNAVWSISPFETVRRTWYVPSQKLWFHGFSFSEIVPSQKSQYHLLAPILALPVKLRLHFSVFQSAQEIPPLMSLLLPVIFVWRSIRAWISELGTIFFVR